MGATSSNMATAKEFFVACEAGKGWDVCGPMCSGEDAKFSCQAVGGLKDMGTIKAYVEFIVALNKGCPDNAVSPFFEGYDEGRKTATFMSVFSGTHTAKIADGFPGPTNKSTSSTYAYVLRFDDNGKICEFTKVWNDAYTMAEFGWA